MRAHADAMVDEPHAGFTKSDKPRLPVISGGPYGFEQVNVAEQRRDPDSLLNWTERIIRMRKEVPEIGWGDFTSDSDAQPARSASCATTGATIPCCSFTILNSSRAK